jgi:hypothetical protein
VTVIERQDQRQRQDQSQLPHFCQKRQKWGTRSLVMGELRSEFVQFSLVDDPELRQLPLSLD